MHSWEQGRAEKIRAPHNPHALRARAPKAIDKGAQSHSLEGPSPLIYGFEAPTP